VQAKTSFFIALFFVLFLPTVAASQAFIWADAGPDQTVDEGDTVILDGSNSSLPALITAYFWEQTGGSPSVILKDVNTAKASFIAPIVGPEGTSLTFQLTVDYSLPPFGFIFYDTDTAIVNVLFVNDPPVADAGPDQSVFVTNTVTLDGSGSSDVDDDPLTYAWSFTSQPPESTAILSDSNAEKPTFFVDKSGTYVIQLIVNDGTVNSDPDSVTIITLNSPPVANAVLDPPPAGQVFVGDTAALDGSGSSDVDDDPLTYAWSFTSQPPGSFATLSDSNAEKPTFVVDVVGTYVVQLIVNDGIVDSESNSANIVTGNFLPIADAGSDQRLFEKSNAVLDGSKSSDKDDAIQSYSWEQTVGPRVALSDGDKVQASFTAPELKDGEEITIVFILTVTDAAGQKASDSTDVTVNNFEKDNPGASGGGCFIDTAAYGFRKFK
jgi:hypothetical protein